MIGINIILLILLLLQEIKIFNKLVRDGMASVIDLGNNRIMVVTEGVEDEK